MENKTLHIDALQDTLVREQYDAFMKLMAYYRCAMMEIETKLNVLNQEFSLRYDRNPISSIKSRLKSPASIREKLTRRGIDVTIENIEACLNDVAGVRVICAFPEDVRTIAKALLKQDDVELIEQKDYILNPKENGYRSLHLILEIPVFLQEGRVNVPVEVQLRTIAMDFWASLEHSMRYKAQGEVPEDISRELVEASQDVAALDRRMQSLHDRIERLTSKDSHE